MIPAIAAAGFFVAVTAALQFSSWAEGWLESGAQPVGTRALKTSSAAPELSDPAGIVETVHAA